MNSKLLKGFKVELYNLCIEYYNEYKNNKSNYNKNEYLKIKQLYSHVNGLNSFDELIDYLDNVKVNNSNSKLNNLMNKYEKNSYYIKYSLYKLVIKYLEIYKSNKTIQNKNNYTFISKIYNDIRSLKEKEMIDYFDNLYNVKYSSVYEKNIINDLKKIYDNQNINKIENKKLYNSVLAQRMNSSCEEIKIENLRKLLENRTITLDNPSYSMKYLEFLSCLILDNYTVKSIVENKGLDINQINYLKEIDNQIIKNPYLFFSLPLSNISNEKLISLKKYMPHIEEIINNSKKLFVDCKRLEHKYKQGNINSFEKESLFKFLSYYMNFNRVNNNAFDYEYMLRDLLNKDVLSYYDVSYIDKYLGYKKCIKNDLMDTEILFGDCDFMSNGNAQHVLGIQDAGLILLNKKHIVGTSFKNNTMRKPITLLNGHSKTYEGLSQLQTIYHELAHIEQYKERYDNKNTYRSYMFSINSIIKSLDDNDFKRNYKLYEVEADANMRAYMDVEAFLTDYLPHSQAFKNVNEHKLVARNKLMFSAKLDSSLNRLITAKYEKDMADKYFKNYPDKLNEYPMFKQFYDSNGKPYNIEEMMSKTEFNNEGYFYNQFVGRLYQNERFKKENYLNKNSNEKITIIKNINTTLKHVNKRLSIATKVLEEKNMGVLFDNTGINKEKLINYNVLVDIKVGKSLKKWHDNIYKVDPNIYSKVDKSVLENYNLEVNNFNYYEQYIKNILEEINKKGFIVR